MISYSHPECVELRNKLRKVVSRILSQKELHKYIILNDKSAKLTCQFFDPIETQYVTEVGDFIKLHGHTIISIPHRMNISIDYKKMTAEIQQPIFDNPVELLHQLFRQVKKLKMDSLLCLDTSGSMSGTKIEELKKAVLTFIQFAEQVDIGGLIGNVALQM